MLGLAGRESRQRIRLDRSGRIHDSSRARTGAAPPARRLAALASLVLALGSGGCATYTDKISAASLAASAGDYPGAISQLNGLLGVSSSAEVPSSLSGDRPLMLLDRGVLQQAVTAFDGSQRDLSTAEQKLELLDLSTNGLAALGSYLYSDSVKTYRTPPTERLSINAVNLLNYLTRNDLSGAAVEARRFQVMRQYLDSIQAASPAPDRLGAYLAGFVFEKSGEGNRALRYYDEALGGGALRSLALPVARLARANSYRGKNISRALASGGGAGGGAAKAAGTSVSGQPEILVVLGMGRVPHKVPQRMPVGAAVGIAGAMLGDRDLDILKYSATKVLVYPELAATPSTLGQATLMVDGREVGLELLADLGASVAAEYQEAKPKMLAAALVRVAARAAVSEGMRQAGNQDSQALGDVLAILVEATMVALDKPDTRSWTMLPDRVLVARVPVTPGEHDVQVQFTSGVVRGAKATVPAKGWAAVVVTEPR